MKIYMFLVVAVATVISWQNISTQWISYNNQTKSNLEIVAITKGADGTVQRRTIANLKPGEKRSTDFCIADFQVSIPGSPKSAQTIKSSELLKRADFCDQAILVFFTTPKAWFGGPSFDINIGCSPAPIK